MRAMQAAYKQELSSSYGITFNSLLCLNNMPIKRYVDYLQRQGQLEEYMQVGWQKCSSTSAVKQGVPRLSCCAYPSSPISKLFGALLLFP